LKTGEKMITSTLAIRPVRNRYLSLWQSAAEETVRKELMEHQSVLTAESVMAHPLMKATVAHVNCDANNLSIEEPTIGEVYSPAISRLHFLIAEAKRTNDITELATLQAECRKYATCDTPG
jgi:hypothetical protein